MKRITIISQLQFSALLLSPFVITLSLLALFYGCQKKSSETKATIPTVTLENLQIAYAKSMKHRDMYVRFSQRAEKERLKNVSVLYRAIARSEEIHAANHASLMRQHGVEPKMPGLDSLNIGTTLQTLKMALSSEEIETGSMYPNLIRTAGLEKDSVASDQFQKTMDADIRQAELLKEALDRGTKIVQVPYFVCTGCGYIMTSDKTDECPNCHMKKEKFEKI